MHVGYLLYAVKNPNNVNMWWVKIHLPYFT